MVTILPSERTPWDVIGKAIGQNVQQTFPGAVQQGFQRQIGHNAIDKLQTGLAEAGGDITKILPLLARAYTDNPTLERSGLGQTYLQQARAANAFPEQPNQNANQIKGQPGLKTPQNQQENNTPINQPERGTIASPSPFNIMTPEDIDAESTRYAQALGDPNAKITRAAYLENQNKVATQLREDLEDAALKAGVSPSELPRFMVVNSHLDPRNPSQWSQEGLRNFQRVKANDKKIQNAFIPGIGSALLGRDRQAALNRLIPALHENREKGLEQEDRAYLADNYVSPAEIETLYHPLTKKHEKALEKLPKGTFPQPEEKTYFGPAAKGGFISYEDALEKAPKELKQMENILSDFFLKNVDNDTSLLGLREKLWQDKDYDWRQIGLALREAQNKGLKLNPEQEREASIMDSQPPMQSLPDIFRELSRIPAFIRGNR